MGASLLLEAEFCFPDVGFCCPAAKACVSSRGQLHTGMTSQLCQKTLVRAVMQSTTIQNDWRKLSKPLYFPRWRVSNATSDKCEASKDSKPCTCDLKLTIVKADSFFHSDDPDRLESISEMRYFQVALQLIWDVTILPRNSLRCKFTNVMSQHRSTLEPLMVYMSP